MIAGTGTIFAALARGFDAQGLPCPQAARILFPRSSRRKEALTHFRFLIAVSDLS